MAESEEKLHSLLMKVKDQKSEKAGLKLNIQSLEGGHGNSLQYSCLENPHGQRSWVGYSPWGHKESDMTEWLSMQAHMNILHIPAPKFKSFSRDYIKKMNG